MASLIERLQLVVDATTGNAETRFAKLGEAGKDAATQARATGDQVAAAADRVAQARLREQDAAGKLNIAETRLTEVRGRYAAGSSQVIAAEENVARAQRNAHVATTQAARATSEYQKTQASAAGETERLGRSVGAARQAVTGLVTAGAALAGIGLVQFLRQSTDGFVEGARTAGQLATSMNATIAQGGQLGALARTMGLDFNDLIEIQAEFAQKVQANQTELRTLGVDIQRNADGTVNWVTTLTDTLGVLQGIPDATERNRLGFKYFGEEGYKQLSRLISSGVSVQDALEQIGTPFNEEDLAAAREYDQALLDLGLAGTRLETTIGRALVPLIADLASGFGTFLDVVTSIPGPIALATVAAIALALTGFNPAALAGERLTVVTAALTRQLQLYSVAAVIGGSSSALLGAGMGTAAAAGRGLLAAVGGPLGAALIVAGTAYYLVSDGIDRFKEASRQAAIEQDIATEKYGDMAATVEEMGQRLADEAGLWDGMAASRRGAGVALDEMGGIVSGADDATGGMISQLVGLVDQLMGGEAAAAGFTDEIENQREELGAYGLQQEASSIAAKTLNDLIAEGTTTGAGFADAVKVAAEAQATQAASSGLAEAAVAAYNAVTRDAIDTQLELVSAELAARDSTFGFLDAMDRANAAVDDQKTSVNEVEQAHVKLQQAALTAAGSAADAAVAAATANGTILTELAEAQIRADAVIADLQARLATPGLGAQAQADIQAIIDRLVTAKENGTIEATLQTLGVGEAAGEIDQATEDRDTTITVESRGGPAVDTYLNGLANTARLAIVRVESRNGPAVAEYLRSIADAPRLSLIRVESRNGPAVGTYLDSLTNERLAIIRVESRGGPAVDAYLDGLANQARNATIGVSQRSPAGAMRDAPRAAGAGLMTAGGGEMRLGNVTFDLAVTGSIPRESLTKAERGRVRVEEIKAYERQNGPGWRTGK